MDVMPEMLPTWVVVVVITAMWAIFKWVVPKLWKFAQNEKVEQIALKDVERKLDSHCAENKRDFSSLSESVERLNETLKEANRINRENTKDLHQKIDKTVKAVARIEGKLSVK